MVEIELSENFNCGISETLFPEHRVEQKLSTSHVDSNNYYHDPKDVALIVGHHLLLHDEVTVSEIKAGDRLDEIGLDDFSKIEVVYMIGKDCQFTVDVSEIEKMRTVNDIVDHFAKSAWIH